MFFTLSKIATFFINPLNVIIVAVVVGAVLARSRRFGRLGRGLLAAVVAVLVVFALLPTATLALSAYEARFPPPPALPARIDGIIALGGAINPVASVERGQPSLNGAAERLTAFLTLARRYPKAKLVYTGGSGSLLHPDARDADIARALFADLGADVDRMVFERRSRNTYDNALFSKALVKPQAGERWLLVTSALHMPRAVGAFAAVDWPVIPYPVDYQTAPEAGFSVPLGGGLDALSLLVHEAVGLVAYYASGRSAALFPGPALIAAQTGS